MINSLRRNWQVLLQTKINIPPDPHRQPQCTSQLVCEDRLFFVSVDLHAGSRNRNASEQFVCRIHLSFLHFANHITSPPPPKANEFRSGVTLLYIYFSQHNYTIKAQVTATCFGLKIHPQAKLRTLKFFTVWLCAFGIPDCSQCVLWFVPCA